MTNRPSRPAYLDNDRLALRAQRIASVHGPARSESRRKPTNAVPDYQVRAGVAALAVSMIIGLGYFFGVQGAAEHSSMGGVLQSGGNEAATKY